MARSQQERSATTQARLRAATYECLVEIGYAQTTTREVLRRSGVSRGAMLHHYPKRDDLLAAAVEEVIDRHLAAFRDALELSADAPPDAETLLERMWDVLSGPTYHAWLDLVAASRTDDSLRAKVKAVNQRFDQRVEAIYRERFPGRGSFVGAQFAFAVLQGLAVSSIYEDPERLAPVRALLTKLAALQ
jgi:AcrR family transcriptional regulator